MKETDQEVIQVKNDLGSETERSETLISNAAGNGIEKGAEAGTKTTTEEEDSDSASKRNGNEKENGECVDENGNVKKLANETGKGEIASEVLEESSTTTTNTNTTNTTNNTTNTTRVRRRKQEHPFKSPEKNDPNFRGVHFYMQNHLTKDRTGIEFCIGGRFDCRRPGKRRQSEVIGAKCLMVGSCECLGRKRKSRRLNRKSFVKECASCRSRKTPLWRDVESVPLCNACGIRFKKYKLRCENCWSVPRKEKSRFPCEQCGGSIQDYN